MQQLHVCWLFDDTSSLKFYNTFCWRIMHVKYYLDSKKMQTESIACSDIVQDPVLLFFVLRTNAFTWRQINSNCTIRFSGWTLVHVVIGNVNGRSLDQWIKFISEVFHWLSPYPRTSKEWKNKTKNNLMATQLIFCK